MCVRLVLPCRGPAGSHFHRAASDVQRRFARRAGVRRLRRTAGVFAGIRTLTALSVVGSWVAVQNDEGLGRQRAAGEQDRGGVRTRRRHLPRFESDGWPRVAGGEDHRPPLA